MSGYIVGPILGVGEDPFPFGWERSAQVQNCDHLWETVLVRKRWGRFEECVRCLICHAPRCGHAADKDPCMYVRHHRAPHRYLSGRREKVGA